MIYTTIKTKTEKGFSFFFSVGLSIDSNSIVLVTYMKKLCPYFAICHSKKSRNVVKGSH